jgi:hypothetical protein
MACGIFPFFLSDWGGQQYYVVNVACLDGVDPYEQATTLIDCKSFLRFFVLITHPSPLPAARAPYALFTQLSQIGVLRSYFVRGCLTLLCLLG